MREGSGSPPEIRDGSGDPSKVLERFGSPLEFCEASAVPPGGPVGVGRPARRCGREQEAPLWSGRYPQRSAKGRDAPSDVREGSGDHSQGLGDIESPCKRSGRGWEDPKKVREWSGGPHEGPVDFPEFRVGSEGPPQKSGRVRKAHPKVWAGKGGNPGVVEGVGIPPRGPEAPPGGLGEVGRPPQRSRKGSGGPRISGRDWVASKGLEGIRRPPEVRRGQGPRKICEGSGGSGEVGNPLRRSGQGLEATPEVWKGSRVPQVVREGLGGPPRGPGAPSGSPRGVKRPSGGPGGVETPPKGPGEVRRPLVGPGRVGRQSRGPEGFGRPLRRSG